MTWDDGSAASFPDEIMQASFRYLSNPFPPRCDATGTQGKDQEVGLSSEKQVRYEGSRPRQESARAAFTSPVFSDFPHQPLQRRKRRRKEV